MKKMIIAVLVLCLIFGAAISVKAMNKPEQVQPEPQTEAVVSGEEEAAVQPETEGESAEEAPAQEPVQVKTLDYEAIYALHDPEEAVMVMDGRDVKWKEYFAWVYNGCAQVENYMNTYAMYGMAMNWDDPMSDDPTDTFAKYATDSAESMLTQMQTIESFCAANGVELSEKSKEEIAKNLEEQIKSYCGEGATEEEFFNLLKLSYMDKDSYKRMNSINYYYQDGMTALYGQDGADVTDEDAQAYLDESGYMNANHILLLTRDMTTGEELDEAARAEKKATAEGLYEELSAITDADELVKHFKEQKEKYDEDTGKTTNPDGYIFLPGQMVPEFENGTLALEDYGVSEPVESTYGYHVILRLPLTVDSVLTTSEEGTPLTARSLCANKLYGEALEAYMGQMKIEYADGFEVPDLTKFIKG